jgi:hypothetical protein
LAHERSALLKDEQPKMLDCGKQGDREIIGGTRAPEDFELTPDGKYLIVANYGKGDDAPIDLFDQTTLKFMVLYESKGKGLINGVSIAIQAGKKIYVGSFQGTRLVILPL